MVLFWALDRFSRSGILFTLQNLKELDNLGIKWKPYSEPYFDTTGQFRDVILSIMATLAKIERERLSERVAAGLRPAKENIRKKGYHITKDGKRITSLGRRPKRKNVERVLRTYRETGSIRPPS